MDILNFHIDFKVICMNLLRLFLWLQWIQSKECANCLLICLSNHFTSIDWQDIFCYENGSLPKSQKQNKINFFGNIPHFDLFTRKVFYEYQQYLHFEWNGSMLKLPKLLHTGRGQSQNMFPAKPRLLFEERCFSYWEVVDRYSLDAERTWLSLLLIFANISVVCKVHLSCPTPIDLNHKPPSNWNNFKECFH